MIFNEIILLDQINKIIFLNGYHSSVGGHDCRDSDDLLNYDSIDAIL